MDDGIEKNKANKKKLDGLQAWLAVADEQNYRRCLSSGTWGSDDNRSNQVKKMKKNDRLIIYVKPSCPGTSKIFFIFSSMKFGLTK